jgi:hypothetical protein
LIPWFPSVLSQLAPFHDLRALPPGLPPAFTGLRSLWLPSIFLPTSVVFDLQAVPWKSLSGFHRSSTSLAAVNLLPTLPSGDFGRLPRNLYPGLRWDFDSLAAFRASFRLASNLDSSGGAFHLHPTFYGGHQLRRTLGSASLWTQVQNL